MSLRGVGLFAGCSVIVALLAGCRPDGETERRARTYFDIPASQAVNADTIQNAILDHVPKGSAVEAVTAFLDRQGLGKDGLSSVYPVNARGELVCRIEYAPHGMGLVKTSFGVVFLMDGDGKLKDVRVREWLTGPLRCHASGDAARDQR